MTPTLSIAIPVYNQDVNSLTQELLKQARSSLIDFELLLFDDGSSEEIKSINQALAKHREVIYREMPSNLGRAAIRNRLAEAATGSHLLFLDNDSVIFSDDFLASYLYQTKEKPRNVICGGRIYTTEKPSFEYLLHWTYGRERESKSAIARARSPHGGFHSNNFIMPKDAWQRVPFDEKLKRYGHEDTLLGYELRQAQIGVSHIENPVIHGSLETNQKFLAKTREALQNLKELYERDNADFNQWHRLLRNYQKIRRTGMKPVMAGLFHQRARAWEKQLLYSGKPSMRIFNLYRLTYLCTL